MGVDSEEKNPLRALFKEDGERSKRLTYYLEHGPRGERDVELILDGRLDEALPSGQTRRERDAWLRGILDPPEQTRSAERTPHADCRLCSTFPRIRPHASWVGCGAAALS